MCIKKKNSPLQSLGRPRRVWAISAVHSDVAKLTAIHDAIWAKFKTGDKVVYTGNYTGYGDKAVETINEILTFRRMILSRRSVVPSDIVYLRGAQEEMIQKLLQLQFSPNPSDILLWMLGNGVKPTLQSYGICPHEGIEACRKGVMGLTKWTDQVRKAIQSRPGHEIFTAQFVHAAHTDQDSHYPMLFVNAGLDVRKPLPEQGDNFWWSNARFENIHEPYGRFGKVVRGYDPAHKGIYMNCVTATIDGGCGFGGELVCTQFDSAGQAQEMFQA